MQQFAKITDREAIFIYTPILAMDAIWENAYGSDVEYEFRQIPIYLAYLLRKYEIVPHWLLRDTIVENSGGTVGAEKADGQIEWCVSAGMFSFVTPEGDRRQKLYCFTKEEKDQLLRVRKEEAMAYLLAGEQMKEPSNLKAGLTEENRAWYRHAMERVLRHDDRYKSNMERIKKLKHLLLGFALVVLASGWMITMISLAGATADKGGN